MIVMALGLPTLWELDHDLPRNSRTLEPCLVLEWNRLKAQVSYMGLPLLRRAAVSQGQGPTPLALDVWRIPGRRAAVLLLPAPPARNNLPLIWRKGGTQVWVDLKRLLTAHPYQVPRGATARIPIYLREVEGERGLGIELCFDQAKYERRRSGRYRPRRRETSIS